jgi:hypothetical protein
MGVGNGHAGPSPAREILGVRRNMDEGRTNHPGEARRCLMLAHRAGAVKVVLAAAMLVAMGSWGAYQGADAAEEKIPEVEYKCYDLPQTSAINEPVTLEDQFDKEDVTLQQPLYLCNPAVKTPSGGKPTGNLTKFPHLKCYKITPSTNVNRQVTLEDQFGLEEDVSVTTARFLCTGVLKTVLE